MKAAALPVGMLDMERSPGTSTEGAKGDDKSAGSAAFDAVLALVAGEVAKLGSTPTATQAQARTASTEPHAQTGSGEGAKDLTSHSANGAEGRAAWDEEARSIHVSSLATFAADVAPRVPLAQADEMHASAPHAERPTEQGVGSDVGVDEPALFTVRLHQEGGTQSPASLSKEQVSVSPGGSQSDSARAQGLRESPHAERAPGMQPPKEEGARTSHTPRNQHPPVPQPEPENTSRVGDTAHQPQRADNTERTTVAAEAKPKNVASRRERTTADAHGERQDHGVERGFVLDPRLFSTGSNTLASVVQVPAAVIAEQTVSSTAGVRAQTPEATAAGLADASPYDAVDAPRFLGEMSSLGEAGASAPQPVLEGTAKQPRVAEANGASAAPLPTNVHVAIVEVSDVEGVERAEGVELADAAAQDLNAEDNGAVARGEGAGRDSERDTERQSEGGEREPDASRDQAGRAAALPAFQSAEVQGARGLEQVVASLLRASNGESQGANERTLAQRGARVGAVPTHTVETGKSEGETSAAAVANASQSLREANQRREEQLSTLREGRELELPPAAALAEQGPSDAVALKDKAPLLAPPVPVHTPDADAAMMGKLARGEGVNSANISVDHPELGAMDLLVQSENGRVDVRATAETPKAAAVLRAHESALRYGIQQAGMTFGALRVRARTGDGQTGKAREATRQRRRNHEWEA